jgi:hypothetical protein
VCMETEPEAQPLTKPIYSAAISVSQFMDGLRISGQLGLDDGVTHISMSLTWPTLPGLNSPDNAGTWLYGVLAQLALHFDEHTVDKATQEPSTVSELVRRG